MLCLFSRLFRRVRADQFVNRRDESTRFRLLDHSTDSVFLSFQTYSRPVNCVQHDLHSRIANTTPYHTVGKQRSSVAKRILIADDHKSMLRAVRVMLESHPGWEVCGDAVSGREAVGKAIAH